MQSKTYFELNMSEAYWCFVFKLKIRILKRSDVNRNLKLAASWKAFFYS